MTGRKVRAPGKTVAVPDHNVPTDIGRAKRHRERGEPHPGRVLEQNAERLRHRVLRRRRRPPGHRPHHRPRAGLDPARHDHRLRRQPHRHPRRLRRARPRHRHERGRARPRHPDADPEEVEEHEGRGHAARLGPGVTAKDITLSIIGETGTAGGTGHVIEYMGEAIRALSMEGRMTVCNMAIEGGARAGIIAPDDKTFAYVMGRPHAPKGAAWEMAGRLLADALHRRGRALRPRGHPRGRRHRPRRHLGHQPRGRAADHRRRPRPRGLQGRQGRRRPPDRSSTWASSPAPASRTSPSTRSSSAPAPTAASRTCARSRRSWRAAGSRRHPRDDRPGLRPRPRPGRGGGHRGEAHRGRLRLADGRLLDVPRR